MIPAAVALAVTSLGVLASIAAQATGGGGDLAPYVSGGGAAAAVAGIVYLGRLMANGKLVSRDVAAEIELLKAMNSTLSELVAQGRRREDDHRRLLLADRRRPRSTT